MQRKLTSQERKLLLVLVDSGGLNSIQLAKALMLSRRYVRRMIENLLYEGMVQTNFDGTTTSKGGTPAQYIVTPHGYSLLMENENAEGPKAT